MSLSLSGTEQCPGPRWAVQELWVPQHCEAFQRHNSGIPMAGPGWCECRAGLTHLCTHPSVKFLFSHSSRCVYRSGFSFPALLTLLLNWRVTALTSPWYVILGGFFSFQDFFFFQFFLSPSSLLHQYSSEPGDTEELNLPPALQKAELSGRERRTCFSYFCTILHNSRTGIDLARYFWWSQLLSSLNPAL